MFKEWKRMTEYKEPRFFILLKRLTGIRKEMSMIEIFIESIPQLCLQAYIIITTQGYITTLQTVTCSISLLAASYGNTSVFNGYFLKCFVFVTIP